MAENTTHKDNNAPKKGKSYNFWKPANYAGRVNARWDSRNTRTFLQACVVQIQNGNIGPLYLNNKGSDGVLETFYNLTQVYYDQKQLRNRWDISKQEYTAWISVLKGATGLGWNAAKGTWDAPEHWWEGMAKKHKFAKRFKDKGLEHTDLLEIIFGGRLATEERQWTPGESIPSSEPEQDDDVGEYMPRPVFADDIEVEEQHYITSDFNLANEKPHVTSPSERVRERVDQQQDNHARTTKRRRLSAAQLLNNTVERMIEVVEGQSNEVTIKQYADTCNATVEVCLDKLNNLPGIMIGSRLYLLGVDLMTVPGNREVFMKLPNDEVRLGWLQDRMELRNAAMASSFHLNQGSSSA